MEVQAAGRIHRLGQDKDVCHTRTRTRTNRSASHALSLATGQVLIPRFAFRDSLESNICALHDKMKSPSSSVVVTDGVLPAAAVRLLDGRST